MFSHDVSHFIDHMQVFGAISSLVQYPQANQYGTSTIYKIKGQLLLLVKLVKEKKKDDHSLIILITLLF